MKFQSILAAGVLLLSNSLFASVLTLTPGPSNIEGVNIAASATGTIEGRTLPQLSHVSASLREKWVPFPKNIYVAQLLVSDYQKFCSSFSTNPLAAVDNVSTIALVAKFVWQVTVDQLFSGFKDSFAPNANNIDLSVPSINEFMDEVQAGGGVLAGQSFTIVGEKLTDGTEALTYENPLGKIGKEGKGNSIHGPSGLIKSVLSIWLGKPAAGDKGLATTIKNLTTCGVN